MLFEVYFVCWFGWLGGVVVGVDFDFVCVGVGVGVVG